MTPFYLLTLMLLLMSGDVGGNKIMDRTDTPPCDPEIVGTEALKKHFPSGPPPNLAKIIMDNGPYAYVELSKLNAVVKATGKDAACVSIAMPSLTAAKAVKKCYVGNNLKESPKEYSVAQKDIFLEYHNYDQHLYRIYPLFLKNNALITYKCCEQCGGNTPNVGIAVPEKMLDDSATKVTVAEAKEVLQKNQLDKNVRSLQGCPKVKLTKV